MNNEEDLGKTKAKRKLVLTVRKRNLKILGHIISNFTFTGHIESIGESSELPI